MSKHPSLKGASTIRQSRNVLKRFERINQLKEEGRWKEGGASSVQETVECALRSDEGQDEPGV